MASDLVGKLLTESIYKQVMSKVIKRSLYQVIQHSINAFYLLEEDTISMANRVLDGFILHTIDDLICQEIVVTQDALSQQDSILDSIIAELAMAVVREALYNG